MCITHSQTCNNLNSDADNQTQVNTTPFPSEGEPTRSRAFIRHVLWHESTYTSTTFRYFQEVIPNTISKKAIEIRVDTWNYSYFCQLKLLFWKLGVDMKPSEISKVSLSTSLSYESIPVV